MNPRRPTMRTMREAAELAELLIPVQVAIANALEKIGGPHELAARSGLEGIEPLFSGLRIELRKALLQVIGLSALIVSDAEGSR